jgi:hypothetical protein
MEGDAGAEELSGEETVINTIKVKIPLPALLHACQESRGIAQEKYYMPLQTITVEGHVWIEPFEDIFFVPFYCSLFQEKLFKSFPWMCSGRSSI